MFHFLCLPAGSLQEGTNQNKSLKPVIDFFSSALICMFPEKLQPFWEHARHLPSVRPPLLPQHRVRLHVPKCV